MTRPTQFSYTLVLNQVEIINLGPYSAGATLRETLNSFTTISGTTLTIAPTLPSHVGSSVIKVWVEKGSYYSRYSFSITILSSTIYFSPALTDQIVSVNSPGIYTLPGITNTGSFAVTITCTIPAAATFITYDSSLKTFYFNPSIAADLGVWNIFIDIIDT